MRSDSANHGKITPVWRDSLLLLALTSAFIVLEYTLARGLMSIDSYSYLLFVHEVCESGWDAALDAYPKMRNFPPLLTLLMYGAGRLSLNYETAGRAINILGVLLYGQGTFFCCRKLYDSRLLALCSALIACSLPNIYFFGCQILRDSMFWAELAWSLFFLLDLYLVDINEKRKIRDVIALALLCGISVLTRREGLAWTPIISLLVIVREYEHAHIHWRFASVAFVLFWGIVICISFQPALWGIDYFPWYALRWT